MLSHVGLCLSCRRTLWSTVIRHSRHAHSHLSTSLKPAGGVIVTWIGRTPCARSNGQPCRDIQRDPTDREGPPSKLPTHP